MYLGRVCLVRAVARLERVPMVWLRWTRIVALLVFVVLLNGSSAFAQGSCAAGSGFPFVRGDADHSGATDIADAIAIFDCLFNGGTSVCPDALDADDSGTLTISDAYFVLYVEFFMVGAVYSAPYPSCGEDPTDDQLACDAEDVSVFCCDPLAGPTTDIDRDGLDQDAEAVNGTDPCLWDTDGDGFCDGDEVSVGSDPTLETSNPISFGQTQVMISNAQNSGFLYSSKSVLNSQNSGFLIDSIRIDCSCP